MEPLERSLIEEARTASESAYCPYSQFPVGASLETSEGARFVGCNIENASYGLTICAERVAIFSAVAARREAAQPETRFIRMLAVSCPKGSKDDPGSLMPCGACRQVMAEFLTQNAVVIVDGVGHFELKDLLPYPFTLSK